MTAMASASVSSLPKTYKINEWFLSVQGEGVRAGIPHLFLRFSGCNLACSKEGEEGFDCDTEFTSGERWSISQILKNLRDLSPTCRSIILTGGEPTLQLDLPLLEALKNEGYFLAIETNGLKPVPSLIDWITVSPKTAEHTLKQLSAHEVKYVRAHGMGIPQTRIKADHYLISPAFEDRLLPRQNVEWCLKLVQEHPPWRLSLQTHKFLSIR